MKKAAATALAGLAATASAQQTVWGQCGGINWTGATTCASGSFCQYYNDWYSQCIPGEATTTITTTNGPDSTTTTTTTTPSTTTTTTPTTTTVVPTSTDFPTTDGLLFRIDGETKYFKGTNCYWCSFLTTPGDVSDTFANLADSGIKILRIWGFNDVASEPGEYDVYFQYLSASGSHINTGANGLGLLDNAVAAAEEHGIKLLINFVNNWDDYGGMSAYVSAFGGDNVGWYTNAAAQAQYKTYVETVVNRYKDSTAIFAWELANEPRCAGCDTDVIFNWATEIGAFIKGLDANHMVTLGDEGFGLDSGDGSYPYQYGEGIDFAKNLEIPTMDFGTFHFYPDHWGVTPEFGLGWVENHGAACEAAGKPCLYEEYGVLDNRCEQTLPWQQASVDTPAIAADAFWQWGDYFSWGQAHDDGYTIYYGDDLWTCLVEGHPAS